MSREPEDQNNQKKLQKKLGLLPEAPGVYLHKDQQGKVIYVGKANRLNQRVRSYFQSSRDNDPKTKALVKRINDFDYIVTDSETDALVLEDQLIKEYRPHYNIRLKDDKQYPYIKITLNEAFPRVLVVREILKDGARYFGPFTDTGAMRETLKFAVGNFKIRTCHLDLPEQTVPRACLDFQIGRCTAPCVGKDTADQYTKRVKRMIRFLEGSEKEVFSELRLEMLNNAENLQFESAAQTRDLINQLEKTTSRSRPVTGVQSNCDICGIARNGRDASGVILRVRGGRILTSHHFLLVARLDQDLPIFLAQLLREYYPRAGDIPGEILLAEKLADREHWQQWLTNLRGKKVVLKIPQRGARKDAVDLAKTNAAFRLREATVKYELKNAKKVTPADIELQEALGLHSVPETIECFDISNFQGKETVGSLVFFKNGKPLKSRYRRFRIKTVKGIDDFASMAEVMGRYYSRLIEKSLPAADLVVVDGGIGQLSAARKVLAERGLHEVQLIGLAKREETIVRETGELLLPRNSEALKLLIRVRDEAHRFAITYHRLLRDQKTIASELDLIPGIGRIKKLSLLHHFGSVAQIRKAPQEQLAAVRGINSHDVVAIIEYFTATDETTGQDPK